MDGKFMYNHHSDGTMSNPDFGWRPFFSRSKSNVFQTAAGAARSRSSLSVSGLACFPSHRRVDAGISGGQRQQQQQQKKNNEGFFK
jgi:hypothetical protein